MAVYNVLVAGVGGQGVLMAGDILAGAALASGQDVKQSELHGMAQRGGSVVCHVRFGGAVYSPVVSVGECDLLIGLEPLEAARYAHYLRPGGTAVYNTHRVPTLGISAGVEAYPDSLEREIAARAGEAYCFDGTVVAVGSGGKRAVNLVMLGAAARFLPLDGQTIIKAVERCVPARSAESNIRAFLAGMTCSR